MAPLLMETFHMTPYLQKSAQRSRRRSPDKTREKKEKEKEKDKKKKKKKNRSDFYSSPLTPSKRTKYHKEMLIICVFNIKIMQLVWLYGCPF